MKDKKTKEQLIGAIHTIFRLAKGALIVDREIATHFCSVKVNGEDVQLYILDKNPNPSVSSQSGWEKKFDEKFGVLSSVRKEPDGHPMTNDLKAFIQQTIEEAVRESSRKAISVISSKAGIGSFDAEE